MGTYLQHPALMSSKLEVTLAARHSQPGASQLACLCPLFIFRRPEGKPGHGVEQIKMVVNQLHARDVFGRHNRGLPELLIRNDAAKVYNSKATMTEIPEFRRERAAEPDLAMLVAGQEDFDGLVGSRIIRDLHVFDGSDPAVIQQRETCVIAKLDRSLRVRHEQRLIHAHYRRNAATAKARGSTAMATQGQPTPDRVADTSATATVGVGVTSKRVCCHGV
jgi:hypothetical protein